MSACVYLLTESMTIHNSTRFSFHTFHQGELIPLQNKKHPSSEELQPAGTKNNIGFRHKQSKLWQCPNQAPNIIEHLSLWPMYNCTNNNSTC